MSSSLAGTILSPTRALLTLLALGGVLLSTSPASAEFEVEHLVNDDASGQESRIDPLGVRLDSGGYFAVWADNSRGHTDVLGGRFDSNFEQVGEPLRVNTDDGLFSHREIAVSQPGGGVFLVVWEDERTGEADRSIYGRLFDASTGEPRGSDFQIDGSLGFGIDQRPRAHTSPNGESLVVWSGRVNQKYRVIARKVSVDGALGPDFLAVPENPTLQQYTPSVTRTPDGRWVVAWTEEAESVDWNIYFRFLSADGTPQGIPVRANSDLLLPSEQSEPDIAVIGARILLVWNDVRTTTADVWGRWIQFDGTFDGADSSFRPNPDSASDQRPRVHTDPSGTFALSWFGGVEGRQRAMVQYYDADGQLEVDSRLVDDPVTGILQRQSFVLSDGSGKWWELWSDDRRGYWDCYAQSYDPGNGISGEERTLRTNPNSASQMYPDLGLFPDGGSVVVWADFRDGSLAVYARLLDASGKPEGASFRVGSVPVNADLTTIDAHETVVDYAPSVAAGPSGFVVTWAINQLGERLNYWAQYFDRNGTRIGENFAVAPNDELRPQRHARPVMLPHGGFAITYQMASTRGNSADPDVFLQLYAEDGLPIEPRIVVPEGVVTAAQINPTIAVAPTGTIYVSWVDQRFGGWDVMAQRFAENGQRLGPNVSQNAPDEPTSDQVNPDVAIGTDRTVCVWENRPATLGAIGGRLEIFATSPLVGSEHAVDGAESVAEGGSIEVELLVNAGRETRGIKNPKVEMAPDGRFLVTWWENADGQTQLFAQRFSPTGSTIGLPYPVHGNGTEGSRLSPACRADNDRIQYVWADSRRSKGWDVRSRVVDWEFSGAPTPVLLRFAEGHPGPGGVDLEWETAAEIGFRGFQVYRQVGGEAPSRKLLPGSVLVTPEPIPSTADGYYRFLDASAPSESRLEYFLEAIDADGYTELFGPILVTTGPGFAAAASPNPFRSSVILSRVDGEPIDIDLVIYDALGRRIQTLHRSSGDATLVWNGRNSDGDEVPTGVYFARPTGAAGSALRLIRIK